LKRVNLDVTGADARKRTISTLLSGTGGGYIPSIRGGKPQTAAYNTARGSDFNRKMRGMMRSLQ